MKKIISFRYLLVIFLLLYLMTACDQVVPLLHQKITEPEIVSISIEEKERNIPLDPVITIIFSETMSRASVENHLFIKPVEGNSTNLELGMEWENNNTILKVGVGEGLSPETKYMMTIKKDIESAEGISLKRDYFRTFTTTELIASGTITERLGIDNETADKIVAFSYKPDPHNSPGKRYYLFLNDGTYLEYNYENNTIIDHVPKSVEDTFPGFPGDKISDIVGAVALLDDNKIFYTDRLLFILKDPVNYQYLEYQFTDHGIVLNATGDVFQRYPGMDKADCNTIKAICSTSDWWMNGFTLIIRSRLYFFINNSDIIWRFSPYGTDTYVRIDFKEKYPLLTSEKITAIKTVCEISDYKTGQVNLHIIFNDNTYEIYKLFNIPYSS